jgi:hypothetical protein
MFENLQKIDENELQSTFQELQCDTKPECNSIDITTMKSHPKKYVKFNKRTVKKATASSTFMDKLKKAGKNKKKLN